MVTTSNQLTFATLTQNYDAVNIPAATAANTYTLITTGSSLASIVTDILFRSADAVRSYDIVICATGNQAVAENARVQVSIPLNSGNNTIVPIASLAALVPALFDIDLAGNRVLTLESGISIYVKNTTLTTGAMFVTAKRRNF